MANRLLNKRCLIVGGTTGIGLAAARRFVLEGARLVVAGLDEGDTAQLGSNLLFHACNATSERQVDALLAETVQHLGGIDVLYHVAGSSGRKHGDGSLHECTATGWQTTLIENLHSAFLSNRAAVRQFLAQGTPGAILNMASVLALSPAPVHFDTVAYAASKGGVIAMSRNVAASYAPMQIRVNVLAPGLIATPMSERALGDPAIVTFLKTKQPLGPGPGTPEDCADAAVFLCSDEAKFITGSVLTIDGGWSLSDGQYAS
jgi:NAD(P)-dependent dehydrogenase (short-subunit alcohol dehydrogenase family)